jgi:putative addiction module component (TIGR02574 family)
MKRSLNSDVWTETMPDYHAILSDASQLPIEDRLRLIDELAASVPDDRPPTLSSEWLDEIQRRSKEVAAGIVATEDWPTIRARLFAKHGINDAD